MAWGDDTNVFDGLGYVRLADLAPAALELFSDQYLSGASWTALARQFSLASPMSAKYLARRLRLPERPKPLSPDWRIRPEQRERLGNPMVPLSLRPCVFCGTGCSGTILPRLQSARVFDLLTAPEVPRHPSGYGILLCHRCQRQVHFAGGFLALLARMVVDTAKYVGGQQRFEVRTRKIALRQARRERKPPRAATGTRFALSPLKIPRERKPRKSAAKTKSKHRPQSRTQNKATYARIKVALGHLEAEGTTYLSATQITALGILLAHNMASIPREIANPGALKSLESSGLISKTEWDGIWQITDLGRSAKIVEGSNWRRGRQARQAKVAKVAEIAGSVLVDAEMRKRGRQEWIEDLLAEGCSMEEIREYYMAHVADGST
jgi:hypothetical protein